MSPWVKTWVVVVIASFLIGLAANARRVVGDHRFEAVEDTALLVLMSSLIVGIIALGVFVVVS